MLEETNKHFDKLSGAICRIKGKRKSKTTCVNEVTGAWKESFNKNVLILCINKHSHSGNGNRCLTERINWKWLKTISNF